MALAREGTAFTDTQDFPASGAALTGFDLPCGTNPDRVALVFVAWSDDGVGYDIETVTVGGAGATSMGTRIVNENIVHGHYLINPGTDNQSVVVDADTGNGVNARAAIILAVCYSGAHQTTPLSGYATASAGTTDADVTVVSAAGSLIICCAAAEPGTWTVDDAGASELLDKSNSGNGGVSAVLSERPGAASVLCQHTPSVGTFFSIAGVSLAPASSSSSTAGAGINRGLVNRGLVNAGLVNRSMTKINGIWQQSKELWRPRLIVPVGISL